MPTDPRKSEIGPAVYKPSAPEGYEWALPPEDQDAGGTFELLTSAHAPVDPRSWRAPRIELLKRDGRWSLRQSKRAAMPWLGSHVLILRDEAIDSVGPLLAPQGNLLPLLCSEARLMVFIAPLLEGALDEARSEVVRFGSGRIMNFVKLEFVGHSIDDRAAFRLAEDPRGDLYLTGQLVDDITATGDTSGTEFRPVWP